MSCRPATQVFLLELSRVVHQLANEGNYHIFRFVKEDCEAHKLEHVRNALQNLGLEAQAIASIFEVGCGKWLVVTVDVAAVC